MFHRQPISACAFLFIALLFALPAVAQPGALDSTFGNGGKVITTPYAGFEYHAMDVAQDSSGGLIVVGLAIDTSGNLGENGFVMRLNANGSLDTSFNSGYGVFLAFFDWVDNQKTADRIEAVAIQPNGQIVIAGSTDVEGSEDMLIMRLQANGQNDGSFNAGLGYLILEFDLNGPGADYALDVALQNDGKIVLAGGATWTGSDTDVAVARLKTDGTPDPSFDGDGRQTVYFDLGGSLADQAEALAIQSDGKIVVAGEASQSGAASMAFARLSSAGALDGGFGSGGKKTVSFTSNHDRATGLAVESGGKIVAGGYAGLGSSNPNYAALRLLSNGSLDSAYGSSGKTTVDFALTSFSLDLAYDLALQNDGKAILVGRVRTGSGYDFGVVRLTTSGQQDSAFGLRNFDFGGLFSPADDRGYGAVLQSDQKLVAVGSTRATSQPAKAAALRLLTGHIIWP